MNAAQRNVLFWVLLILAISVFIVGAVAGRELLGNDEALASAVFCVGWLVVGAFYIRAGGR